MEEVWKDITTLTSSHSSDASVALHQSSFHEFLASPTFPPTQTYDPKVPSSKDCSKKVNAHIKPGQSVYGGSTSFACANTSPTLSSVFASSLFPIPCTQKGDSEDNNACGDRRYKRKMKNRESATRSRARRQAYTNELEVELAHLRVENAKLRRIQQEICSAKAAAAAAAAATVPLVTKKNKLLRSLTAPF